MNETKINTHIAEWMGWVIDPEQRWRGFLRSDCPDCNYPDVLRQFTRRIPQYTESLDACHEVVMRMNQTQKDILHGFVHNKTNGNVVDCNAPTMAKAIAYALGLDKE